jgi:hypothetical protein
MLQDLRQQLSAAHRDATCAPQLQHILRCSHLCSAQVGSSSTVHIEAPSQLGNDDHPDSRINRQSQRTYVPSVSMTCHVTVTVEVEHFRGPWR